MANFSDFCVIKLNHTNIFMLSVNSRIVKPFMNCELKELGNNDETSIDHQKNSPKLSLPVNIKMPLWQIFVISFIT